MSYSLTTTNTFTQTNSQYVASKIMADLRRLNSYYGKPTESQINDYYTEIVEHMFHGYLKNVEYGFKKDGLRVVSLKYEINSFGTLSDSSSGSVYARADITGATFFSFLTTSTVFDSLTYAQQQEFKAKLSIKRGGGEAPKDGAGYWTDDKTYFYDGLGAQRKTFRPY